MKKTTRQAITVSLLVAIGLAGVCLLIIWQLNRGGSDGRGSRSKASRESAPLEKEPRLEALSAKLAAVLEDGKIPSLATDADKEVALRDPQHGAVADYRAWIGNVREYSAELEETYSYRDLPIVKELTNEPINAAWQMEAWAHRCTAGATGPDAVLGQADSLISAMPGFAGESYRPPLPESNGKTVLEQFVGAAAKCAEIVDKEALAQVSPEDRELLRFVIPWICHSGGTFLGKSKGSPFYWMTMMFEPSDVFKDGDKETALSKTPVPPKIKSLTGLARYLHSLAGQPLPADATFGGEAADQPSFTCQVNLAAMHQALSRLRPYLTKTALDELQKDILKSVGAGDAPPSKPLTVNGVTGKLTSVVETPYGRVIVGGPEPNGYEDVDALAILDLGGDDEYLWKVPERQIAIRGVQVIVDFAGDDVYQTTGVGGPGTGLLGIGILIDRAGNDRYCQGLSPLFKPRDHTRQTLALPDPEGTQTNLVPFARLFGNPAAPSENGVPLNSGFAFGAGFLGIGLLADESGDDIYLGQKLAFGCGFWSGVGVLHDSDGDDVYAAGLAAIGAGINGGFGLLDDHAGDDHYQCLGTFESPYSAGKDWDNGYLGNGIGFGSSWRVESRKEEPRRTPSLGGGLGLVNDGSGNDMYVGSSFGVASAYAGGVGSIIDNAGNDTYFAKRGPGGDNHSGWSGGHSLGSGCHRGLGYLLDRAGNDRYSGSDSSSGTGWDMSSGFLIDLGGNDLMTDLHGKGFLGNAGSGGAKALGVSCHFGGTDTYQRSSFGSASNIAAGYPGKGGNFSFFFDLGPEIDQYPKPDWNNTTRPGAVSQAKEDDGKEYPQGIGLSSDGTNALTP